jgi:peptidyl-tRNA hydrolase, PTH1 family
MTIVIGLGNPGKKYEKTRHNIGHEVVAAFAKQFGEMSLEKKVSAQIAKGSLHDNPIIAALPTTFMNESGTSAQALLSYYKETPDHLIVVHDDLDLPLGTIRISTNSSAGGQRGVQSIIDAIGTKKFTRIRIGIAGTARTRTDAATYVLKPFSLTERLAVSRARRESVEKLTQCIEGMSS